MKFDMADMGWMELHELMAGAVTPRPIALISTVGARGVYNGAPYSFYGIASVKPAIVFVGSRQDRPLKNLPKT
jgi:flavin reductase (DIM6/NTAB) family NADH-FMN oxidoreductase RutF